MAIWVYAVALLVSIIVIVGAERGLSSHPTVRTVIVLVFSAIAGGCIKYFLLDVPQHRRNEALESAREGKEEKIAAGVAELVARGGGEAAVQELVELKYKQLFSSSSQRDVDAWVDQLLKALPERAQEASALAAKAHLVVTQFRLRWEPLYRFVLESFDTRITRLQASGVIKDARSEPGNIVEAGVAGAFTARTAVFNDGSSIGIRVGRARIENGKLYGNADMYIRDGHATGNDLVASLHFTPSSVSISSGEGQYDTLLAYQTEANDPVADDTLRERIEAALNAVISRAAIRAAMVPTAMPAASP